MALLSLNCFYFCLIIRTIQKSSHVVLDNAYINEPLLFELYETLSYQLNIMYELLTETFQYLILY